MTATLLVTRAAPHPAADELAARYRERLAQVPCPPDPVHRRLAVAAAVEGWLRLDGIVEGGGPALLTELVDELAGLGPLEPLLADARIGEIIVDGTRPISVEIDGRLLVTELRFRDQAQLRSVIERMLVGSGRRVDDGVPMVDARLDDGSRLNAVLPPIAVDGPLVTIRRPPRRGLDFATLVAGGGVDRRSAAFLHAAVLGRCNLLICGAAGAGKTTMLAALAALVPEDQRLVVLEDVAELAIEHPRVAALQCRQRGRDVGGEVTLRDLVRNSLRMRPDRLIVGEVRGAEAADMVQAMNTGHDGSMTTLHANTAVDAMTRLASMLAIAWPSMSDRQLCSWVAAAVDVVAHVERSPVGERRVVEIGVVERVGDTLGVLPIFVRRGGAAATGCGEVPGRCLERMARNGVRFPPSLFAAGVR